FHGVVVPDHEAGVEKPRIWDSVSRHAFEGRLDDLSQHLCMHSRGNHGGGRVSAHASRIGSPIAVEKPLVILTAGKRESMASVTHYDETRFLTFEIFLDDHPAAGSAQLTFGHHA